MINECCEHHKAVDFGGTIVKWCASANRPQVMWGLDNQSNNYNSWVRECQS